MTDERVPNRIVKLSEDVINKIAAGEVIQRPSNALKELLENSLDAHSTSIKLFLRDGGISEMRIEDNGDGILQQDFTLLCERFATSKLTQFEDLYSIQTYGFRGEALASISFCAQLTITSKTRAGSNHAYRAQFVDGHMYDPEQPDMPHEHIAPQIVAGIQGTQIIVKNLFYNMRIRQKALRARSTQEYNACLRVVGCYAIHNCHCSFAVHKLNDSSLHAADLQYRATATKSHRDVIKLIYGGDIDRYLIDIERTHAQIRGLQLRAVISNCDFAMNVAQQQSGGTGSRSKQKNKRRRIFNVHTRMELVLFINHRLVESNQIKKCVMSVYNDYLAKNHYPFVYLSIVIPSNFVDVNVHPTKKEVRFLHQEQVLTLIQSAIDEKLRLENEKRTFHAQSLQSFMSHSQLNVRSVSQSPKKLKTKTTVVDRSSKDVVIKCNTNTTHDQNPKQPKLIKVATTDKKDRIVLDLMDSDEDEDEDQDDDLSLKNEADKTANEEEEEEHSPLRKKKRHATAAKPYISDVNRMDLTIKKTANININDNVVIDVADDSTSPPPMDDATDDEDDDSGARITNNQTQKRRKRSYSEMINEDNDDDDEDVDVDVGNTDQSQLQSAQPNIVMLDLNEKKRYKAKKATRVRTDAQQSNLDYYWTRNDATHNSRHQATQKRKTLVSEPTSNTSNTEQKQTETDDVEPCVSITYMAKKQTRKSTVSPPSCVTELIGRIRQNCDSNLKRVFEENVYVGCIDCGDDTCKHRENAQFVHDTFERVLFQYDTKLYLCNIHRLSRVYFFELCVSNIGRFSAVYKLTPNAHIFDVKQVDVDTKARLPTIYDLVLLALQLPETEYDAAVAGPKHDVAQSVTDTLCQPFVAQILRDYFAIDVDIASKCITSIPCLMSGYVPPLLYLPLFVFRLVSEIEWFRRDGDGVMVEVDINHEHTLFKQIAMEVARLYQIRPPQFYLTMDKTEEPSSSSSGKLGYLKKKQVHVNGQRDMNWILEHVIFRSMNKKCKKYAFHPPKFLCTDGSIVQIACTKQLYKVFERC